MEKIKLNTFALYCCVILATEQHDFSSFLIHWNNANEVLILDSCAGFCGNSPNGGQCWCDSVCVGYGDCCHDAESLCRGMWTLLTIFHVDLPFTWYFRILIWVDNVAWMFIRKDKVNETSPKWTNILCWRRNSLLRLEIDTFTLQTIVVNFLISSIRPNFL